MEDHPRLEPSPDAAKSSLEELANSLTHGIGIPLGIAGLVLMEVYAAMHGSALHVVTCAVFGTAVIALYSASTLYHSAKHPASKDVLRIVDHACIYFLIAGTYTPFLLAKVGGAWGWTMFGVVWGLAVVGVVFKVRCCGEYEAISLASYLGLGWLALVAFYPLLEAISGSGILLLAAGGLSYTVGALFYRWDERIPFGHSIWHLFVLAGTVLHFFAVFYHVIPTGPA